MANSYPTCTRRTQQPDTPNQLAARTPEHSVNTVPLDRITLSALKARIDQIEHDIAKILTLISPCKRNSTVHEAARHLNATDPENEPLTAPKRCPARDSGHVQTDASSSRDSARGSTRSSSISTNTDAGTRFTSWADSSVGMMRTFNRNMGEVSPPKRKRRSKEEQEQTNEMRLRGACDECRSKKRQCKPEHTPSKPVKKKRRGRGHPHSSHRSLDLSRSYSTQEMPPLHSWTNDRRASLPNPNLPGLDLNSYPGNRRACGVHKSSSPSVPLADQAQASSPTDIHQDQPSMIPPGQSYPLCSGPYLDVPQFPGAVSSQFVGTAWLTPYLHDPKAFHGHPVLPYVQGYMDYSEGYVARSGFPTNIGPRFTEFNPYGVSNDDLLHLDDPHQVQEMCPPYHHGFYRDRPGISQSTYQTQDMSTLTCTQGFGCVPGESPRLLQARLQKSENADPKRPARNSPAHQGVDLHDIPCLPPIEPSTDRSLLPLQSSGHPATHSRGSSPENLGFDWDEDLVTP